MLMSEDAPTPAALADVRTPLPASNAPVLVASRVASVAGDWLFSIAIVWLVLQITGSSIAVAAVSIAQAIPFVLFGLLFAGSLDTVRNKKLLLTLLDFARAAIVLAYPVLHHLHALNVVTLVAVSAVLAAIDAVFTPGLQSMLPEIVVREGLPKAHAMLDATERLGRILGPGLSGLLLVFLTTESFFYIDSGTYLISALGLVLLAVDRTYIRAHRVPAERKRLRQLVDFSDSVRYLRGEAVARRLLIVRNVQNTVWAVYTVGVPIMVYRVYHSSAGLLGAMIACYAAGQLIGNRLALTTRGYRRPVRQIEVGWGICSVGFIGFGIFHNPVVGIAALVVAGIGGSLGNVSADGYLGYATPAASQGRVFALQSTGNQLSRMVGNGIFGAAIALIPVGWAFIAAGLVMLGVSGASAIRRIPIPAFSEDLKT